MVRDRIAVNPPNRLHAQIEIFFQFEENAITCKRQNQEILQYINAAMWLKLLN